MITFICAVIVLLAAYFTYGRFVEKTFGADQNRVTPATTNADGVDYVPMNTMKVYLIQFLNIAGLGPIFGPIMGALYGPAAFIWIIVGSIFAGGVHDYMSGMMSVRTGGISIAEISGDYLGEFSRYAMLFISVILLLFVGVVFIVGPASLLANLTFDTSGTGVFEGTIFGNKSFWVAIIFAYYFVSTIVPVDKVIGKVYPFFGAVLMFMAVGVAGAMIVDGLAIPELTDIARVTHLAGTPVWPALFFTISCGALSGFHATQSPLMARTIKNETLGRRVFYGAMITEAIIAMIWAAVGMAYFPEGLNGLSDVLTQGGPGLVVNKVAVGYLGVSGGLLAILGVIVAPITSGDTAFRSIRLTISDRLKMPQGKIINRLIIAVPIFVIAFLITKIGFKSIWMYFTFSNQLLSTFVLWTATAYLYQHGRNFWISAAPGVFMTASLVGYILTAKEFPFGLSQEIAVNSGFLTAAAAMLLLIKMTFISKKSKHNDSCKS
ncbi:MAG: carbon starvation protein A [Deltaproteobacteria bacterium]|nr:carbon starvation protein A [Deltaproteobacteria bacterium]